MNAHSSSAFNKTVFLDGRVKLFGGDSHAILALASANSIDAIVTDPPYALVSIVKRFGNGQAPARGNQAFVRASAGFMGKKWDNGDTAHSIAFWRECLRVLKPGGYVLAFGGTRTYHRLACAIEDAGFDVRDMVQWLYGSGFPKSHDVSKGIDKAAGAEREVVGVSDRHSNKTGSRNFADGQSGFKSTEEGGNTITAPATEAAQQWQGWGTALKPACEPICMARKPLSEGTVAANVLRWGTGAINIDGCRVDGNKRHPGNYVDKRSEAEVYGTYADSDRSAFDATQGRFPANVITDGSDEVVAMFPTQKSGGNSIKRASAKGVGDRSNSIGAESRPEGTRMIEHPDKEGSAARFFYQAKANKADRAGSKHPTVKPIALMRYLCRLITPPGGTVLDPFAGSGTTGEAARLEGFNAILIEREAEYLADIAKRFTVEENPEDLADIAAGEGNPEHLADIAIVEALR